MIVARALATLIVLAWAVQPTLGAPPPGVYETDPSKELADLINKVKNGEESAIKPLGERDEAAPHLRGEVKRAAAVFDIRCERLLAAALAPIENRIYDRNKKRYAAWADGGRLDLCAEFLVVCEHKDGFTLADQTLPLRTRISQRYFQSVNNIRTGIDGKVNRELFILPTFDKRAIPAQHEAGSHLTVASSKDAFGLIRADRCVVQALSRAAWFVAVRSDLRQELSSPFGKINPDIEGEWWNSVVMVNNSVHFTRLTDSLIVCDGDIELTCGIGPGCVVIANGNIWSKPDKRGNGRMCYFAATGDITLPKQTEAFKSVFHAGGTVTLGGKLKHTDVVRERQAVLPFGVRFLETEEFGLELEAHGGGVRVTKLDPASPFAKFGVESGDVVTAIDDVKAPSARDFRRQLRRGVVAESVTLHLRRGARALTRIVFLDGVPTPTAPAPR